MLSDLPLTDIVIVLGSLLVAMGFHEAMHAFTAHQLGDTTAEDEGRLTLNPLKHIDIFTTILLPAVLMLMHLPPIFIARPVPFDPSRVRFGEYGAALIALAGPFTNLALAAVTGALISTTFTGNIAHVLMLFMVVNISLFVFNMIPFPPLDGSRLLYAFAPTPIQRVMSQIESFGLVGIIIFILLFFPFIGPLVSNIVRTIYNALLW